MGEAKRRIANRPIRKSHDTTAVSMDEISAFINLPSLGLEEMPEGMRSLMSGIRENLSGQGWQKVSFHQTPNGPVMTGRRFGKGVANLLVLDQFAGDRYRCVVISAEEARAAAAWHRFERDMDGTWSTPLAKFEPFLDRSANAGAIDRHRRRTLSPVGSARPCSPADGPWGLR